MSDENKKPIDSVSGIETTGHEWDEIQELNNPMPRWWLWVWFATIVWGAWYVVVYPTWPTSDGSTAGTSGYTQYKELYQSQQEILARQAKYLEGFEKASFDEVLKDPALYTFAVTGGKIAFKDNCATCHGSGGAGAKGYPNLNDDDWLWAGDIDGIYETLLHGIRADNLDTRLSQMPAFGKEGLLNRQQIDSVVDYVLSLSPQYQHDDGHHGKVREVSAESLQKGAAVFQENCASCHGADAKGDRSVGAPNLTDAIWLYGSDRADVFTSVYNSRAGVMPAWKQRLDDNTIRQLTLYVHQLGGGENAEGKSMLDEGSAH